MKITRFFLAVAITTMGFAGCAPKDADIKTSVETKLRAEPGMSTATADVKAGVATISGECTDNECKAHCEKITQEVKGVKSVINNLTVAVATPPAVTAPVIVTPDDPLTKSVADATKDFAGVTAEVNDGVVTLIGDIKKNDLPRLMKALSSLKPKKIENKLTVK